MESDSSFPHHIPDPVVPENLKDLVALVKEGNLDAGFGFDGDCDRIGVVAENGSILWGDQLLIIYSNALLAQRPGSTIIYDVKCTRALEEEIRRLGGTPIMWKTGHSLIEDKLHETGAVLAGELSGHIYFADSFRSWTQPDARRPNF
jgi:phosphomannomutase